ncbi:hypothetical protein [Streptomyces flaveolus]|uniref:hypothetical protein n=1 Tax=Streptomyces flaveolus TaxID=67297 RepID=UPI00381DE8F7
MQSGIGVVHDASLEDDPVPQALAARHQPHRRHHGPPPRRLRRGSALPRIFSSALRG